MLIRRAVQRDAEAIARLAAAAAAEEGAVAGLDVERVRAHGFGPNALFEAWVALEKASGPPIAHAIVTRGYDVRRGCATMVLCELYVVPGQRRGGLARRLMSAVAQRARDLSARELAITTGVENNVAQRFFSAIGAKPDRATVFMMSADEIEWLAAEGL